MRLLCIHIPDGPVDDPNNELPELIIGNEYTAIDIKPAAWIIFQLILLKRPLIKIPQGMYYKLLQHPNGYYHESYFGQLDSGIEEKELELIHSHEHAQGHAPSPGKRGGF